MRTSYLLALTFLMFTNGIELNSFACLNFGNVNLDGITKH